MAPAPTGEPGYAPASKASSTSAAVIVPSFFAPIFTRLQEPHVGPLASNVSARLISIFTAWPVLRDSSAATGSRYTGILPPKPPPISMGVTRICDTGISSSCAIASRTVNAPCVLHQMCSLPSLFHSAVALCGSM